MNYSEISNFCKKGYLGLIPGWIGYIKWNYNSNQLEFKNGDYTMPEQELLDKIGNRNDLYYII